MIVTILSRVAMMIGFATVATRVAKKENERKMRLVPVKHKNQ